MPPFVVQREIVCLVHVHQFAGMAAEHDFDPQAAIKRQRRQDDALIQIMAVGQMDHSPQMLLVIARAFPRRADSNDARKNSSRPAAAHSDGRGFPSLLS